MLEYYSWQRKASMRGMTFEEAVQKEYGGAKHLPFYCGKRVTKVTEGVAVPDIVRIYEDALEIIECKSILVFDKAVDRLKRQLLHYKTHLPYGTRQRIVFEDLDFDDELKEEIREYVYENLCGISPELEIDFLKR